jgi:SAM-dependent methyltransferase
MRKDAIKLEDERLEGLNLNNYPWFHERHRIFPKVFKNKRREKILDIAAGMGVVAKRIRDGYPSFMLCNDISELSLKSLKRNQLDSISFDLDEPDHFFPFPDETFDVIISLATMEHIINLDHHIMEIRRILQKDGYLYISAPNYSGIHFIIPFLIKGKTFHDPMKGGINKYEFYAHVRYFTYKTLLEFISSFGFKSEVVYLPLPGESSRYLALKRRSKPLALFFRFMMWAMYKCMPPRWAFHPILCFSKGDLSTDKKYMKPKKVIL